MSQRQRFAKPEQVNTLADWVARWPRAQNLGFDPVTREPTVSKGGAVVTTIPWKREADTLTVLTQPSQFSAEAVTAATQRFGKIRDQTAQKRQVDEEALRIATSTLLDAWRTYRASAPALRGPMRRDIMSAEADVREAEARLASKNRQVYVIDGYMAIYLPPMPSGRRGIGSATATETP